MVTIGNNTIGRNHPPCVIAEVSGNHNQSLDRALEIVDAATAAGAHAIKLQTYRPDTITLDIKEGEFVIGDPNSIWKGRCLYELYQEAHTPWEWHAAIIQRAQERGIACFSTPFDETAVEFLETLNVPCYKLGSFECTHLPLIRRIARTGKPLIISTGMATLAEIDEAVRTARRHGCPDIVLLKCTSNYPASPENSNLRTIPHLRELFDCEVGLSDHTLGIGAAVAAIALGATVIEKHITLSRADGGVDSVFSLEPDELKALVQECMRAWQALGCIRYGPTESERGAATRRRSLYISKDMGAGEMLTADNVKIVRPGLGLPPKYYDVCLGRRVKCTVKAGTALSWDIIA
jgi:N-acetylneuraminate synthase